MNRLAWVFAPVLIVSIAQADTMTLKDGRVVAGQLEGYAGRKFQFKADDGATYSEYALDIKSIVPDAPRKVAVKLAAKQYDDVEFIRYDNFTVRVRKNGQQLNEPVISLSSMEVAAPADPDPGETAGDEAAVAATVGGTPPRQGIVARGVQPRERDWKRTGKWREMEEDKSSIISNGEEVDIEAHLKKGLVNIVHFHYPKSLTSIREGNYVAAVAAKKSSGVALVKVVMPDFEAPVCKALDIRTAPQFWFYSPSGKLVKKLTDRFTEHDIDSAVRSARR